MLESGLSHEVLGECASVRSQNSSHFPSPENVKTWTLSLVLLSLCRDRNYKRNPKTLTVQKLSFLSDFSLLIPLVLWLNNGRVTILCRRMMKQSRRGGGILCKNWSNQLPLYATFPTIIKKSAKSLLLYRVNLMNIFPLNLLSKVYDFWHDICWHCTNDDHYVAVRDKYYSCIKCCMTRDQS